MPFPYTQQVWADADASKPLSAARMGVLEAGIALAGVVGTSSSPPGSPVDGMLWRLPADSSNGIYWLFQYDSSQATNKWVFMGGPPMISEVATSESTASTSYVDLATVGPSITVPRAGDYLVSFGASMSNTGAAAFLAFTSVKLGAAATADAQGINYGGPSVGGASAATTPARTMRLTGLSASTVLKLQYKIVNVSHAFSNRFLNVTPIRVI